MEKINKEYDSIEDASQALQSIEQNDDEDFAYFKVKKVEIIFHVERDE